MKNTVEMRQERAALVKQARAILDAAEAEKRDLTAEEQQQYDRIMEDVDKRLKEIEREERQQKIETGLQSPADPEHRATLEPEKRGNLRPIATPEYREAFLSFVRFGKEGLQPGQQQLLTENRYFNSTAEQRALSAITGSAGGYTVPQDFYARMIEAAKPWGGMREVGCTVINTDTGNDLPIPMNNDTSNIGEIVSESAAVTEQDTVFTQKILKAHKYSSKKVLVPLELLQDSFFDIEAWLANILGVRIGRITNLHFTTGSGVDQPQGVVTGASEGKVGATGQTTSVTYDDLIDLEHSVNRAYRRSPACGWMFADTTLKAIKKLKDSQQRPLWQPGLEVREPDTIMGYRYTVNDDVPAMAASAKSILFGDFSNYFIRDVMAVTLFRMGEKYIENGQIGFLCFSRHDGGLVDAGLAPVKYYQNSAT